MAHQISRFLPPLIILAVLGFGGWYIERQRSLEESTLSGYFENQPAEAASRITGRVARILPREGDVVKAGQTMVILEARPAQAETRSKQALAEQARSQYQEVRNGPRPEDIHRQESAVAEAQANLSKLEHGPRPEEIGAARARLRRAEAHYLELAAGPRPQEAAEARAAERAALARLAQAKRGPTPEEKAEAKARVDAVAAQTELARADEARIHRLFDQDAVTRQQMDQASARTRTVEAEEREVREALRRAQHGTPPEELAQARQMYRQAQAALALVLAGSRPEDITAASAEVAEARENLALLLHGSRPEDIQASQAHLAQAQSMLDTLRAGSRKEEISAAQAAARAAAEAARASGATFSERVVRAPIDGVVERVLVAAGDLVAPNTPIVRLANPNDIWIRVYVPESQLSKISVGDSADLKVNGIPNIIKARVTSIATRGEFTPANLQTPDERGKQVFGVRLQLTQPDSRIKAGMYATVKYIGTLQ